MLRKRLAGRFLRTTMLSGVAAAAAMPAFAQDEGEDDVIIVSGTRIQREDLAAPSPVTTVDSEQLVLTNTVNSEQFLNTLPQVIPSFDSTSNNPGDGSSRVNLRGLGTQRTLVLVDGARFVGLGPSFVVDLNNIPAALVERIDVVTGGASAVGAAAGASLSPVVGTDAAAFGPLPVLSTAGAAETGACHSIAAGFLSRQHARVPLPRRASSMT